MSTQQAVSAVLITREGYHAWGSKRCRLPCAIEQNCFTVPLKTPWQDHFWTKHPDNALRCLLRLRVLCTVRAEISKGLLVTDAWIESEAAGHERLPGA